MHLPRIAPRQMLVCVVAIAVLLGVFALYLQPSFLFTLAQQVWSCF